MDKAQAEIVFAALEKLGVVYLTAEYSGSGSGDSGQFDGIVARNAEGKEIAEVNFEKPIGEILATEGDDEIPRIVAASLLDKEIEKFSDQLEQMAWNAVDEAGHNGFWNDKGGDGKLIFDVLGRTITLEHRNRIDSFEGSSHDVYSPDPNEEEPA